MAEDPYPNPMRLWRHVALPTLKPGDEFCEDLQLMRYREPGKPGTYTIRVYHDLGWEQAAAQSDGENLDSSDIPPGRTMRRS